MLYFSRQEDALAALNQGIVQLRSTPRRRRSWRGAWIQRARQHRLAQAPLSLHGTGRAPIPRYSNPRRSFAASSGLSSPVLRSRSTSPISRSARSESTSPPRIRRLSTRRIAALPAIPRVPYVTDEAIRAAISVTDHPKAATANPKDFYDNRFLQELKARGSSRSSMPESKLDLSGDPAVLWATDSPPTERELYR